MLTGPIWFWNQNFVDSRIRILCELWYFIFMRTLIGILHCLYKSLPCFLRIQFGLLRIQNIELLSLSPFAFFSFFPSHSSSTSSSLSFFFCPMSGTYDLLKHHEIRCTIPSCPCKYIHRQVINGSHLSYCTFPQKIPTSSNHHL